MKGTVILVHGAWGRRELWKDIIPELIAANYRVRVIELPGHGRTQARRNIRWLMLNDYVKAVEKIACKYSRVILVGHSMGGLIVQLILNRRKHHYLAGVLLNPVPPSGILKTAIRFFIDHPLSVIKALVRLAPYELVANEELAKRRLFGDFLDEAELRRRFKHVGPESAIALLQMLMPRYIRIKGVPVLVIRTSADRVISRRQAQETAWMHQADLKIIPGIPHMSMYGDNGILIAREIIDWLAQL